MIVSRDENNKEIIAMHIMNAQSDDGAKILIHLGMDTVKLEVKYLKSHIKQGDKVKKGDLLMSFDIDKIKAEGYSMVSPIIVTNTSDYLDVVEMMTGAVKTGDEIISCLN